MKFLVDGDKYSDEDDTCLLKDRAKTKKRKSNHELLFDDFFIEHFDSYGGTEYELIETGQILRSEDDLMDVWEQISKYTDKDKSVDYKKIYDYIEKKIYKNKYSYNNPWIKNPNEDDYGNFRPRELPKEIKKPTKEELEKAKKQAEDLQAKRDKAKKEAEEAERLRHIEEERLRKIEEDKKKKEEEQFQDALEDARIIKSRRLD